MAGSLGRDLSTLAFDLIQSGARSASAEAFRAGVLEMLTEVIDHDVSHYVALRLGAGPPTVRGIAATGLARYLEHPERYAPDVVKATAAAMEGNGIFIDTQVYTAHERETLPFFVELIRPLGVESMMNAMLTFRGRVSGILGLGRRFGRPHFETADIDALRPLLTAIAVAQEAFDYAHGHAVPEAGMALNLEERRIFAMLESAQAALPSAVRRAPRPPRVARSVAPAPAARTEPDPDDARFSADFDVLTGSERRVADYVYAGYSNPEISTSLGVSRHTVRNQIAMVFVKLGVTSRTELAVRMERTGLGRLVRPARNVRTARPASERRTGRPRTPR